MEGVCAIVMDATKADVDIGSGCGMYKACDVRLSISIYITSRTTMYTIGEEVVMIIGHLEL